MGSYTGLLCIKTLLPTHACLGRQGYYKVPSYNNDRQSSDKLTCPGSTMSVDLSLASSHGFDLGAIVPFKHGGAHMTCYEACQTSEVDSGSTCCTHFQINCLSDESYLTAARMSWCRQTRHAIAARHPRLYRQETRTSTTAMIFLIPSCPSRHEATLCSSSHVPLI